MSSWRKRWGWLLLSAVLLAVIAGYGFSVYLRTATYEGPNPVVVELAPGASFSQLATRLEQLGILEYPSLLTLYAIMTSQSTKVKAGEYHVLPDSSPLELLKLFTQGKVISYSVTIVEGWRFSDLLRHLSVQKKLQHQLKGLTVSEIMALLGRSGEHPEGLFFPDSYQYVAGSTDLELLRRALNKMQRVLQEEWQLREENLPYESAYEALIMASIVEKETGVPEERDQIAGVFVRRLKKGMRLQTDPTVIYGLGSDFSGNLTRKHLRIDTPYNTYLNKGLPPTPIALAGREAIYAALHPAQGSSLYFVARGDGTHFFSDTLEQHKKAVQQYQVRQRRSDYRSTPRY